MIIPVAASLIKFLEIQISKGKALIARKIEDDYLYEIEEGAMTFMEVSREEINRISLETADSVEAFSS